MGKENTKITYLTVTSVPWRSAHSIYVVKMCQAMGEYGADVELHCCRKRGALTGSRALEQYGIKNPAFSLKQFVGPYGIEFFGRPEWELRFYWAAFRHLLFLLRRKIFHSKEKRIFICHNTLSMIACALLKVQYYYDFHAIQMKSNIARFFLKWHPPIACFVQSIGLKKEVKKIISSQMPIILTRNAISDELFDIPPARSTNNATVKIGYVGSLGQDRGIFELCEACRLLHINKLNIQLLIAGGMPDQVVQLQQYVVDNKLDSFTKIIGHVDQSEVLSIYSQCDILVAYYKSTLSAVSYMSPMKIFEYMATGRAILASDVPTIREIVTHGIDGWLVQPDAMLSLKEGLEILIGNRELRLMLGEKARKNKNLITWADRAKKWVEQIKKKGKTCLDWEG